MYPIMRMRTCLTMLRSFALSKDDAAVRLQELLLYERGEQWWQIWFWGDSGKG